MNRIFRAESNHLRAPPVAETLILPSSREVKPRTEKTEKTEKIEQKPLQFPPCFYRNFAGQPYKAFDLKKVIIEQSSSF
jgi:hypothetical protein